MLERLISFSPQLSISRHSLPAERLEYSVSMHQKIMLRVLSAIFSDNYLKLGGQKKGAIYVFLKLFLDLSLFALHFCCKFNTPVIPSVEKWLILFYFYQAK